MSEYAKPLPVIDDLGRTFWSAAKEGRLLVQRCSACGTHQFYPRLHCITCGTPDPEWVQARGTGKLHTFSIVHRTADAAFAAEVPYAFGIVELDEGPRLTVNVVDTPLDELVCDMPVRIVFTNVTDEFALPNATRA